MPTKTERLHISAAAIVKGVGGDKFLSQSGKLALTAMQRNLLNILVRSLVQETGCAPRTARRHIRAALGLIDPIGVRAMRVPLPVQTINFRATKAEEIAIRPEVRAFIKTKLAEVRAKSP